MWAAVLVLLTVGRVVLGSTTVTSSVPETNTSSAIPASFDQSLTQLPTDSRASYGDFEAESTTILSSASVDSTTSASENATSHATSTSTSSATKTLLSGTNTYPSTPTNGAKCNGYTDFCGRKYSNITYVVAHNSPFHIAHNEASNQVYDVITQLNDGVRGIQSETHYVNETVMLCHTSCDELNAGTLEQYLVKVKSWLDYNRNEVITILLGNEDFIEPGNYTAPVTNAGLLDYIYIPPTQPMDIDDWPTLGSMILSNKRVVMMLAYDANQKKVPWLLDMWSYQWQTPFSPTNVSFPCTVQRPPGQDRNVSARRLMLANHNLNVQLKLAGLDILIPNSAVIDNTNANTTDVGTASRTIQQCTDDWGRPPNYLLVDYYNRGNFNGSSLAAAAEANNVTYDVNSCCDHTQTSEAISNGFDSIIFVLWLVAGAATVLAF